MIRLVVLLVLTAAFVNYVAVFLADLPGTVPLTLAGYRADVPAGLLITAVAGAAVAGWSLIGFLLRAPRRLAQTAAARRGRAGHDAIVRGLVAVGAGDVAAAQRLAARAARRAPDAPLLLMLQAQAAQLAGRPEDADAAFRAMAQRSDTRLFGLHGLFVEATRRNDPGAARAHAEAAAKAAPSLAWAGEAALELRCRDGDWAGALEALERNRRGGLVAGGAYRRRRAVLLTAQALSLIDADRRAAGDRAGEAARLCPELAPATALAGRLLAQAGEPRRAAAVLEAGWRANPHPDIAAAYADLVPGASAHDRLGRMRHLFALNESHPESAIALAAAALAAKEFAEARRCLAPLAGAPTRRVATLMARLEAAENADEGRAREWMARAVRAAHDPVWTADGVVADNWMAVSPVSGRLDAFEWRVPVADLTPQGPLIEHDPAPGPAQGADAKAPPPGTPEGAPRPNGTHNDRNNARHHPESGTESGTAGGTGQEGKARLPDDPGPAAGAADMPRAAARQPFARLRKQALSWLPRPLRGEPRKPAPDKPSGKFPSGRYPSDKYPSDKF